MKLRPWHSFRVLRLIARTREAWRRAARAVAELLPKGLYRRSLLIVVLPMVLLQTAVTLVFMQHHWELVTRRLSEAVARDVGALTDLYRRLPPGEYDNVLASLASERFRMTATLLPTGPLPPPMPHSFFSTLDPLTRTLPNEIKNQVREPIWLDTIGRSGLMEIRVDLGDRTLRLITRRSLAYEANAHIFVLWMLATMLLLLTVAIVFLRNQIRPILRLAKAAEDFGKGRLNEFSPHGAREVRQAGHAFIEMKRRVERATEQRTAMLNGVSHDLRTMLTRFKLSLALIENTAETDALQKDVDEMGHMLEAYLAFARGDGGESATETDIGALLSELGHEAEKDGATIGIAAAGNLKIRVRRTAMRRCIGNLVVNASRHADHVNISAARRERAIVIQIDDDGCGIPAHLREDVFRPFYRLDEARNQDQEGSGLGLAIARDIARSHGGDITLSESPMGGLQATVRLPV